MTSLSGALTQFVIVVACAVFPPTNPPTNPPQEYSTGSPLGGGPGSVDPTSFGPYGGEVYGSEGPYIPGSPHTGLDAVYTGDTSNSSSGLGALAGFAAGAAGLGLTGLVRDKKKDEEKEENKDNKDGQTE